VPMDAFTFLSTRDQSVADSAVKHLNEINDERKGVVASMAKAIKQKLKKNNSNGAKEVIVAGDPEWKPSLLGLAANALAEEYDRPVFLWGRDGREALKGSARSNGRVDLVKVMEKARSVLDAYGGHQQAGGFAVSHEKIHMLEDALIDAAKAVGEEELNPATELIDTDLTLDDVTDEVYSELSQLAPFGVGNAKPTFRFPNIIIRRVRSFGKQNNHLELVFHTSTGREVKAIGFFASADDYSANIRKDQPVTLIASMERSYFRGRPELRLRIVDIQ
ncbi:MAG: DHHA1 domain-containing protein, partial [Candidatus Paceibacterota bacterium]